MSSYDYQAPPEGYFPSPSLEGDDLHRAKGYAPHVVTFWNAVCAFIDQHRNEVHPDHEIEYPSWGQWRSIEQHVLAGRRIEAIRLLRAATCVWEKKPLPMPAFVTTTAWKEFMLGNGTRQWEHRGGLGLGQAKSIIETFENYPQWFGRDPARVFAAAPAQGDVPGPRKDSTAPTNLGAILREALERNKEAPSVPTEEVWVNIYRSHSGYIDIGSHESRESADRYAAPDRLACIRVEFKEGEGL